MVQQFKVCICSSLLFGFIIKPYLPDCRTILQSWQDKTQKASNKMRSIMEHSPGLPQESKSLRSCSGNQAKMLLKGHLGIKCHSQTVQPIVNGGDCGCIVRDLETIIVLVLLAFNFIPQRSHHSLTLPRLRIRDSATATLMLGMAQQPSKWSHQHDRSTYFPTALWHSWYNVNQFTPTTIHHYVLWLVW